MSAQRRPNKTRRFSDKAHASARLGDRYYERHPPAAMNPESRSLPAKIFAAALGFALVAAVPLLTGLYVARAHAAIAQSEPSAAIACTTGCVAPKSFCARTDATCGTCSPERCAKRTP